MTSITHLFRNRSALFARAVGLLLILFIFYGTTIEAAHRHGNLLSTSGSTSVVTSEQTSDGATTKVGCNDCLICQLHQNFSASLISVKDATPLKLIRSRLFVNIPKAVLSQISSPSSGRAPPFTF
ncbi:MAG TPA: hypothetical protein VF074_23975 [Pyrinomonadaceae bacterium]